MKNIIILAFFILGLITTSCDRNIEFPTISVTDPALQVQVEGPAANNTFPKIAGATVNLYSSDNALLSTKVTDSDGHVTFTKSELKEKGVFSVTVSKDALTKTATTPYMLLNDGVTLLIVQLQ